MSNRWKRKRTQFKNLESAHEAKRTRCIVYGHYRTAARELVEEGGEVIEEILGERSELRNAVDGSSSDDCGNGHRGLQIS